eukprot:SAG11_NODE_5327_length_1594_cov_2.701713_3_plen_81_part_00
MLRRSATKGPKAELGKFSTNHGCTYDPRITDSATVVVSDRANSRFQMCEVRHLLTAVHLKKVGVARCDTARASWGCAGRL